MTPPIKNLSIYANFATANTKRFTLVLVRSFLLQVSIRQANFLVVLLRSHLLYGRRTAAVDRLTRSVSQTFCVDRRKAAAAARRPCGDRNIFAAFYRP